MRRFLIKFWTGFLILGRLFAFASQFLYAETSVKSASSLKTKPYSSNELLIQFKPDTRLITPHSSRITSGNFQLDSLNSAFRLNKIISLFPKQEDFSNANKTGVMPQIFLYKFDNTSSLANLKKRYESLDIVDFAEFNYRYFADFSKSSNISFQIQDQFEQATRDIKPNHAVIIGIIDTGCDWNNKALISRLWVNSLEKLDGKDNDGNGFVDDIWGWNFVNQGQVSQSRLSHENRPVDECGHGTQIAEIIDQFSNRHSLTKESDIKNQLMILKSGVLSPDKKIVSTAFATAQAIIYAADHGAQLINLAWNSNNPSHVLQKAIEYAVAKGCVIIAAAGDKNSSQPHYPAAFENVWAVTATNDNDEKLNNSNYGQWIDIVAPGVTNHYFSSPDSAQLIPSGTAIATANVSALAALLLSCENIVANDSLKRRIIWSSEDIYKRNPDYSGKLGAGRINILRAINSQHQPNIIIQNLTYHLKNQAQFRRSNDIVPITINIKNLSSDAQDINITLTTNDPYLTIIKSAITIPLLHYHQEFTNEFDPFTLIVNPDYPSDHEAKILANITTSNGFSLEQTFTFTNRINPPEDLTIINNKPINLTWTGSSKYIGYYIYRKQNEQQSYDKITELPILDQTYEDTLVKPGIEYFYYISGIDSSGWESPSSNVVSIKLRQELRFLFYPIQDTLIANQDSIRFLALPQFDDVEDCTYQWALNSKPVFDDANDYFIDSYRFQNNNRDTVTVIITNTEFDTTMTHRWVLGLKNAFQKLMIKSVFPASDTTLSAGDSIKFHISLENANSDSLIFQWQMNDKIIEEERDHLFVLFADSLSDTTNLITATLTNQDTVISYAWKVYIEPSLTHIMFDQFIFSPKSDTTIYEGDSLDLTIQIIPLNDSLNNFQWQINGEADSSTHQTNFLLIPDYSSAGIDTIVLNYQIGDSSGSYQWLVTILDRNRPPEILSYSLPTDTTISFEDTLVFFVDCYDPDQNSLSYRWYINQRADTSATDSFYTLFNLNKESESDTISAQISDADTSIYLRWVVHYLIDQNQAPQIISASPPLDSMLVKADSMLFRIYCNDPDGDTLQFTWSANGVIDTTAHNATYLYRNLNAPTSNDTLNVIIADADTSIKLEWILWADDSEQEPTIKLITWFPEQDSLIAEGDSLIFLVQNADDSCRFQWKIDSQLDPTARDSIFVYYLSNDPMTVDTIRVDVFAGDSIFYHEWHIHYLNWVANQSPLIFAFRPEQSIITANSEDRLKFSARIFEGDVSGINFQWSVNNQIDTTAIDTVFYFTPENLLAEPDTIKLVISRDDTTVSHQWIVHCYQQQKLPAPHLIFPIKGNRVCEEDHLAWKNDSSLVQIDSTTNWNYLVQLSSDSTFSNIICSDSCNTTSIKLNNLSGFDRISIGKPIYWRVKVHSGYHISEFSNSNFPFTYYPQFAQLESFFGEKKEDGTIELLWTTVNEYNCVGFNIYRSESQDDNFEMVNENLIVGRHEYSFQDLTSMAGKTYFYKLEEVNIYSKKKFHHTISITAAIPAKFSLTQNYPNPFNTETSFKYEIPTASHVKVEVCNVLGRKVKTLVNEKMEAGFYIVFWDGINEQGENVVSGIYFYSLITNKGKITRKMVVVR